jgi:cellulose synthase/poly-beta-1,6-N-acetylglucosamine synthase-like glycosyltransferase
MDLELIAYPFIFAAIYFEAFLLVTFLSKPARESRALAASTRTPLVSMVVPCYNEAATVGGTADSLLALDYPADKLKVILVDDGSTDDTKAVMARFAAHPQVTVISQENGGKHAALNAGIAASGDAEIIGCLDADSFVEPSALREMIGRFDDPKVGAVTPAMSVHKPSNLIEHMQNAEFVLGIALRHILAAVNGLYVTPGPFSLYRRSVIDELGGFRFGHQTEDMEMALRIQKAGYAIESAHTARVFTKVPRTVPKLIKQRTRWTSGFMRNMLHEYRSLVGNPRYGALGTIVLPLGFLAILGGIVMTTLLAYQLGKSVVDAYFTTANVPLSFTLGNLLSLDWFYLPLTLFVLLALVAAVGSVAFIVVGKRISNTPASLGIGLVGYLLMYGLIAPFWLVRAVADVATNTRRAWR